MSNLPTSWVETNLGTVVPYGATDKAEPKDLKPDTWVLELEDIEKDSTKVLQRLTFSQRQSKSTKNRFDAGDVLYGKLRPYLNKVTFADQPGVCTTEIVPIKPTQAVNGRYLFHWLRHPRFLTYVTDVSHGVNMPRLGTDAGRQAPFVLAPKNEQKRIADKLDTVLTRVDAVNTRLARVAPILKRFRQSVLAAATSGRLTEDWRRLAKVGLDTWSRVRVSEMSEVVDPHPSHRTPPEVSGGVPYISIGDITSNGGICLENARRVSPTVLSEHNQRYRISKGDFIFGKIGTLGKPAKLPVDVEYTISANVLLIQPNQSVVIPDFAFLLFSSPDFMQSVIEQSAATSQTAFGIKKMRGTQVGLPSLEEQTEIVRRVETLFAFADRLEARLQTAQTATERLTPALLAKAFRGELVPQDPNDEPASELLKRLAASAPASTQKRGRPKVSTAA